MSDYLVSMTNINKYFGGVHALKGVDLNIRKGEVHCLAGENGSGKSTVIKVLSGVHKPDTGQIRIGGTTYSQITPQEAIQEGIQVIYQDFSLFPNLTVRENLSLNTLVSDGEKFVSKKRVNQLVEKAVNQIGLDIDLDEKVGNLPVAEKQMVAISRALLADAKLLVMDEPTTALTKAEVARLFKVVEDLKARGVSILFVSHKLDEMYEISDRITIFRNGRNVITSPIEDMDEKKFSYYMTGRTFDEVIDDNRKLGKVAFKAENLTGSNFKEISFEIREGEILGITGQLGCGRTELTLSMFGLEPVYSGNMQLKGEKIQIKSPNHAQELGMALVPEDRLTEGLFLPQSIKRNIVVSLLDDYSNKHGVLNSKDIDDASRAGVLGFSIATNDDELPVGTLSGGNQQKVLLARWLATRPKVLMLNCPTAGVDIGAKYDIYNLMRRLAQEGMAIIVGSDDITEVSEICDRVLIMKEGQIIADIEDVSEEVLNMYI